MPNLIPPETVSLYQGNVTTHNERPQVTNSMPEQTSHSKIYDSTDFMLGFVSSIFKDRAAGMLAGNVRDIRRDEREIAYGDFDEKIHGAKELGKEVATSVALGVAAKVGVTVAGRVIKIAAPSLNRIGLFGAKRGESISYVAQPTLKSARELKQFGLNTSQRKAFYQGKQVIFEDPATSYPAATIFKYKNNTLRAGIYDIISDEKGALTNFLSRSRSLAQSLGVKNLEVFGADIQNERLLNLLSRRGFEPGNPVLIDAFGFNKEVSTIRKIYDLKLQNQYKNTIKP